MTTLKALSEDLRTLSAQLATGGDAKAQARHLAHGKCLPRERLRLLLDEGSSFLEIGLFAGFELYDEVVPAAGVIAGIGRVSGQECMIVVNDATVKGGTYFPITVKKHFNF